ncbi:Uncharacterised protein [Klebsiella pneumoniae]|uniref:Uncharacterized protein n=1 Tax=Klebsiella pneumoniae TaxID=573 RepID=A0A377TNE6_KLEPN|nr:Uncharacterised protein [Klebsiella pneumoniae]
MVISTALTATMSLPRRAPNTVSAPKHSCSSRERSMMSRFNANKRRRSPRQAFFSIASDTPRSVSTRFAISRPIMRVAYSAVTVASAAPWTFIRRPITSHRSSTIFNRLPTTSRITGAPGVLDAQQPAEQHQVGQRGGGAEPANFEKPSRLLKHRLAAADNM